eukprot:PhM_4_TR11618/c1_g1_i7/m.9620/K17533/MAP3K19, YSK4; mitogen-activated protein kinase kinase kinase 19
MLTRALSVRVLPAAMTVIVMCATVALCFGLSFSATNSIISQTRRVDRDSLDRTHAVTRDNLNSLTSQLMRAMHSAASESVMAMVGSIESTVRRYQGFVHKSLSTPSAEDPTQPTALTKTFVEVSRSLMMQDILTSYPTVISVILSSGHSVTVLEAPWLDSDGQGGSKPSNDIIESISDGRTQAEHGVTPDAYHPNPTTSLWASFCPLTPDADCNTTFRKTVVVMEGGAEYEQTLSGFPILLDNFTTDEVLRNYGFSIQKLNETNNSSIEYSFVHLNGQSGQWTTAITGNAETIVFSYTLPVAAGTIDAKLTGMVGAGLDLEAMSDALRRLPQHSDQRVFVVHQINSTTENIMFGTSHGTAIVREYTGTSLVQRARSVSESDDYIISGAGRYVARYHNNSFRALDTNNTYYYTVFDDDNENTARSTSGRKKYLMRSSTTHTDSGIDFSIVVVVPYDQILAGVEENTKQVIAEVEHNDNSLDEYYFKTQVVGICALIVFILIIFVTSVYSSRYFTMPLIALRADMARVAMMDFDALPRRKPAIISEVRSMQHSFDLMVEYLREFRAFVPQAVLAPREEVNAGVVVDPTFESIVSVAAAAAAEHPAPALGTPGADYLSPATSTHKPSVNDAVTAVTLEQSFRLTADDENDNATTADFVPDDPRAARLRGTTMQPFNASFVAVRFAFLESDNGQNNVSSYNSNVLGQHPPGVRVGACGSKDVDRAHALHQAFVERCLRIVERNEGVVVRFEASLLVASWNAFRPCHQHEAMACHVAQELDKELCDFHIHVLVSSGHVLVGFLGSERVRSPVVLGDCMNDQDDLVRLCGVLSSRMLVTESVAHKVTTLFELCPVDVVRRDVSTTVYELLPRPPLPPSDRAGAASAHARHSDMYALYQRRHATFEAQATVYNMAFSRLVSSRFAEAESLLLEFLRLVAPSMCDPEASAASSSSSLPTYDRQHVWHALRLSCVGSHLRRARDGADSSGNNNGSKAASSSALSSSPYSRAFPTWPLLEKCSSSDLPREFESLWRVHFGGRVGTEAAVCTVAGRNPSLDESDFETVEVVDSGVLVVSKQNSTESAPHSSSSDEARGVSGQPSDLRQMMLEVVTQNTSASLTSAPSRRSTPANGVVIMADIDAAELSGRGVDSEVAAITSVWSHARYYRSSRVLGRGATGRVYLGLAENGTQVAMKCMRIADADSKGSGGGAGQGATAAKREIEKVLDEVQMMSELRHDNIVTLLDTAIVGGEVIVIQELISGGALSALQESFGKLPVPTVQRYVREILHGLVYLHRNDILHRDIKGQNVLLTVEGQCKLADFGAAAKLNAAARGGIAGTPLFMAPEAVLGNLTKASDVWSVGILTCFLLTGESPFRGARQLSSRQYMTKLAMETGWAPDLTRVGAASASAERFVSDCLQRSPLSRPGVDVLLHHEFLLT